MTNHDSPDARELESVLAQHEVPLPPAVETAMRAQAETLHARIQTFSASNHPKENWLMKLFQNNTRGVARWATASILLIAALMIVFVAFGDASTSSYAAVVERIQKAVTIRLNMKITGTPNVPEINIAFFHREPGLTRIEQRGGVAETVSIVDISAGKILSLIPPVRKAMMIELGDWKASDQAPNYFSQLEDLKNLPAQADEASFGELDGRRVRIYLLKEPAAEKFLWVDDASGDLLRYVIQETGPAPSRIEMTGFEFNIPIDDSLFAMQPPAGYELVQFSNGQKPADWSEASEQHLIDYLRVCESIGAFPSVLDSAHPFESAQIMADSLQKSFRLRGSRGEKLTEQMGIEAGLQLSLGIAFVNTMKPENDYHYAGAGLTPGNPNDWILWYKPNNSQNYRVIHGDLSVTEATPVEVAAHTPQ